MVEIVFDVVINTIMMTEARSTVANVVDGGSAMT